MSQTLPNSSITLDQLARQFGGDVVGNGSVQLSGINSLEHAQETEITFLTNSKYKKWLDSTQAGAIIVSPADQTLTDLPRLVNPNPYLLFAKVTAYFHPTIKPLAGVHPSAVVEKGAKIALTASVGAFAYIGEGVNIGENCVIGHHASIEKDTVIGDETMLYPRVTIYHNCVIGKRVILHSGVVIGADGFGLAPDQGRWVKIPQIGRVVIHDDVEVGANTTVDRGALEDTVIEEGVKLDNLIQIAHNVRIGAHTAIAACVGIAGSAKIGKHCTIGGNSGVIGHTEMCDNVHVSAHTLITKSITKPGQYTSQLPNMTHEEWLKSASHIRRLGDMADDIKLLKRKLKD